MHSPLACFCPPQAWLCLLPAALSSALPFETHLKPHSSMKAFPVMSVYITDAFSKHFKAFFSKVQHNVVLIISLTLVLPLNHWLLLGSPKCLLFTYRFVYSMGHCRHMLVQYRLCWLSWCRRSDLLSSEDGQGRVVSVQRKRGPAFGTRAGKGLKCVLSFSLKLFISLRAAIQKKLSLYSFLTVILVLICNCYFHLPYINPVFSYLTWSGKIPFSPD